MVDPVTALRSGDMTPDELIQRVPLGVALDLLILAEWRGAEEEVHVVPDVDTVRCVCGVHFHFRTGTTRARCPGCGARYERREGACT